MRAMFRLFTSRRRRWRELFSLAIDDRLSETEAAELQRILDRWPEARRELDAMREAVTALRAAPQVEPRRSFRITPDMVEAEAPVRGMPAFVPAAAGAAALLVFAITGGALGLFDGGPTGDEPPLAAAPPTLAPATSAPAAESFVVTAAPTSTPAPAATPTPEPAPTTAAIESGVTAMPAPTSTPAPAAIPTPEPAPTTAVIESGVTAMPAPTSTPAPTTETMPTAEMAAMMPEPTATPTPIGEPPLTSSPTATPAAMFVREEPTAAPRATAMPRRRHADL